MGKKAQIQKLLEPCVQLCDFCLNICSSLESFSTSCTDCCPETTSNRLQTGGKQYVSFCGKAPGPSTGSSAPISSFMSPVDFLDVSAPMINCQPLRAFCMKLGGCQSFRNRVVQLLFFTPHLPLRYVSRTRKQNPTPQRHFEARGGCVSVKMRHRRSDHDSSASFLSNQCDSEGRDAFGGYSSIHSNVVTHAAN